MAEGDPKWLRWVAVTTTTIFAVSAAIASIKSGGFSSRIGVLTTKEANSWSYYQAKSLKEHGFILQRDAFKLAQLSAPKPEAATFLSERLAEYDKEIARYASEREQIKREAEGFAAQQESLSTHSVQLGLAVMFLQIAIMMSSIGALVKQQALWLAGVAMGAIGVAHLVIGLLH